MKIPLTLPIRSKTIVFAVTLLATSAAFADYYDDDGDWRYRQQPQPYGWYPPPQPYYAPPPPVYVPPPVAYVPPPPPVVIGLPGLPFGLQLGGWGPGHHRHHHHHHGHHRHWD